MPWVPTTRDPATQVAADALLDIEDTDSKRTRLVNHWAGAGAGPELAAELADMESTGHLSEEYRVQMLNKLQAGNGSQLPPATSMTSKRVRFKTSMPTVPTEAPGARANLNKPFQMLHEPIRTPYGNAGGWMPEGWQETGLYDGLIPPQGEE